MGESQLQTASTPVQAFVLRWGWGHLKDHMQECDECDGTGVEEPVDDENEQEDCPGCNGEGEYRWGSYYREDIGTCAHCDDKRAPVAQMYEDGGCYESGWVCLPCYVDHHRKACGCNRWKAAEEDLFATRCTSQPSSNTQEKKT